jgi:GntR family transcriptional regulator
MDVVNVARAARRQSTGVVLHHQFYVVLRQRLADNAYEAGRPLPSEPKLAEEFGVSRTTVRRALARLESEQLIVRRHGSGTFPLRAPLTNAIRDQVISLFDNLATVHKTTTTRLVRLARVATPSFILERYPGFGANARLLLRTRSFAGRPFALLTSHVYETLGKQLDRERLGHKPLTMVLEELGEPPHKADQIVAAVGASLIAAQHLDTAVGSPLLAVRTVLLNRAGALIAHLEALYIPDFYEYRVSIVREKDGPWVPDEIPRVR